MNPDYHIEHFWLEFKKSMNNFYNDNNFARPIALWSTKLNELQKLSNQEARTNLNQFMRQRMGTSSPNPSPSPNFV